MGLLGKKSKNWQFLAKPKKIGGSKPKYLKTRVLRGFLDKNLKFEIFHVKPKNLGAQNQKLPCNEFYHDIQMWKWKYLGLSIIKVKRGSHFWTFT